MGSLNSNALRDFRTMSGISLRALAARAGVDKGYLSRLESGTAKNPSPDMIRTLAEALGVSVASITYPHANCPNCAEKAVA